MAGRGTIEVEAPTVECRGSGTDIHSGVVLHLTPGETSTCPQCGQTYRIRALPKGLSSASWPQRR